MSKVWFLCNLHCSCFFATIKYLVSRLIFFRLFCRYYISRMNFLFGNMSGGSSEFDQDIFRCPFLRNINEPTNFSFSNSMAIPVPVPVPVPVSSFIILFNIFCFYFLLLNAYRFPISYLLLILGTGRERSHI